MTTEPTDHEVDMIVGEGAPPPVSSAIRSTSPRAATAARSMESAVNYPSLRTLGEKVDVPMTTDLRASPVPVLYLSRSSIRQWGRTPPVWNKTALVAHFSSRARRLSGGNASRAGAVFVAKNCHSRNGRETLVKRLSSLLHGGVDRPGQCLHTVSWPLCGSTTDASPQEAKPKRCGKHAVLRQYPFYLALENSDETDYVSEKVFHALESGVLPVYAGAPNVADFVPPHSVVELRSFDHSVERLAAHLNMLLDEPDEYAKYFEWKRSELPDAFQRRFASLVGTHAKCRLCRWSYAHKYELPWDQQAQRPVTTHAVHF